MSGTSTAGNWIDTAVDNCVEEIQQLQSVLAYLMGLQESRRNASESLSPNASRDSEAND